MSRFLGYPYMFQSNLHLLEPRDPDLDVDAAKPSSATFYLIGWSLLTVTSLAMIGIFAGIFLLLTR